MANNQSEQDKKYIKMGAAIAGITWILYAVKFIVTVTIISGIILFILHKPLWLAPVIAVALFTVYRLICRILILIGRWATNDR